MLRKAICIGAFLSRFSPKNGRNGIFKVGYLVKIFTFSTSTRVSREVDPSLDRRYKCTLVHTNHPPACQARNSDFCVHRPNFVDVTTYTFHYDGFIKIGVGFIEHDFSHHNMKRISCLTRMQVICILVYRVPCQITACVPCTICYIVKLAYIDQTSLMSPPVLLTMTTSLR